MEFRLLFTHTHVVSELYDFLYFVEHMRRYFEKCLRCLFLHIVNGNQNSLATSIFPNIGNI